MLSLSLNLYLVQEYQRRYVIQEGLKILVLVFLPGLVEDYPT